MSDYFRGKIDEMRKLEIKKDFLVDGVKCKLDGIVDFTAKFVQNHQLLKTCLWDLFANQFVLRVDGQDGGWRGEYWGKMMRGACMTYQYTQDEELYQTLFNAVKGLIATQDSEGRITTYGKYTEFSGWDMWCRKYVLLGLEHFYLICKDEEFKQTIVEVMKKHLDYVIKKVGAGDNQIDILQSTTDNNWTWGALNSSSILEPVVKLYNLTADKKYLDFASYIIKRGGSSWGNVFELALKNEIAPYQYPVKKAYEMMSFFEGVIEYYRVTGDKNCKTAFLNFIDAVIDTDVTVIGCSGCTHELFDNSAVKQTEESELVMQETCVTVTLMKTCYQALRLTGDAKYASVIERAYYNAMLSSVNFNKNTFLGLEKGENIKEFEPSREFLKEIEGFTFDSYSPLVNARRNVKVGGFKNMENGTSYGCCVCIGSAGTALIALSAVMYREDGLTVNHYVPGTYFAKTPSGQDVRVKIETEYPYGETVKITLEQPKPESYTIALRIPSYSDAQVSLGWRKISAISNTYFENCDVHNNNTVITLKFDNKVKATSLNGKVCVSKGAIVYAIDERNQKLDVVVTDNIIGAKSVKKKFDCMDSLEVIFSNGEKVTLTDYAFAGKNWNEENCKVRVWLNTQNN